MPDRPATTRIVALLSSALVAIGLVGASAALTAAPAVADTAPAAGLPSTVTDEPLPAPQIDGVAWSQIIVGGTVYVGGSFTTARPAGAAAGVDTVPRSDMLAYDVTTGALISSFAPVFNGQVRGLAASADGSVIYAVGNFSQVGGVGKNRVVALDARTGAVITGFKATVNGQALAVAVSGGNVYVAGSFTQAGASNGTIATRGRVAAFSGATGALTPFAPNVPDGDVRGIVVDPSGTRVAVAGSFSTVNGASSRGSAMVDAATGAVDLPWSVTGTVFNNGSGAAIYSLTSDGTNIYGTGYSYYAGGNGPLEGTFSASWRTGAITWIEDCHGDTYSSAAVGGVVYIAGHPHYCGDVVNGFPQASPWVNQRALAFTTAATGVLTANRAGGNYVSFAGTPSPTLLDWYPAMTQGTYTGQAQGPWSVAADSDYVVYGGEFPTVNGLAQQGLVRFAVRPIAPGRDGPRLTATTSTPWTIRATSTVAGSVRIAWPANYDRDDANLTYTLLRDGRSVFTTTAKSQLTSVRPMMSFTDTGLAPGSAPIYQVRATDPDGNSALSATASVAVAATTTSSVYARTVLRDGPTDFWQLNDAAGPASTLADSAGVYDLAAQAGVTIGVAGAGAGNGGATATSFSGTSVGSSSTTTEFGGTDAFSLEAWFRTTTTTGGKIIGMGGNATGTSAVHDRDVFLNASGNVSFAIATGPSGTVTTPKRYNDGRWHQVVATLGAGGMQLSLDGAVVASNATPPKPLAQAGYWRVGGDAAAGGDPWFDGTLEDVAVYDRTVLTPAQISAHYTTWTTGVAPASGPAAAFTATGTGLSASFDASSSTAGAAPITSWGWDFGDGASGAGATASHAYARAGTYPVVLTITDANGATATTTKQVVVRAPDVPPTASFTSGSNGLTASFDASSSSDPDGVVASYAWDFGDGSTGAGATPAHAYAAAGSYPVTLVVTDDGGATGTVTRSVTVTAPAQHLAQDAFGRTTANGLGTADVGGAWTVNGAAAPYSTDGSAAVFSTGAGKTLSAILGSTTSSSATVQAAFTVPQLPTSGTVYGGVVMRVVGSSSYVARFAIGASGKVTVSLLVNGASGAGVVVPGLTASAGDVLRIAGQAIGTSSTSLGASVWRDGAAQPDTWQATSTDSTAALQKAGSVGLTTYLGSTASVASCAMRIDDFTVDNG